MLPCAVLHDAKGRVVATLPMQLELQSVELHSNDDFFKNRAQNPLARRGRCSRLVPQARQIDC